MVWQTLSIQPVTWQKHTIYEACQNGVDILWREYFLGVLSCISRKDVSAIETFFVGISAFVLEILCLVKVLRSSIARYVSKIVNSDIKI